MCNLLNFVKNLLVALFWNDSFLRIATAWFTLEKLLEYILEVEFCAPTEALCKRKSDSVSVVDLAEHISIRWINYVTAKHAWERVKCKHSTFTSTTACYNKISSTAVKKDSCEDTILNISKRVRILCRIHTIIVNNMSLCLSYSRKSIINHRILSCLTILINQCNTHNIKPAFFFDYGLYKSHIDIIVAYIFAFVNMH